MRIRIDIDDNLLRRAKAEAARRGCKLDALMVEALELIVNARVKGRPAPSESKLLAKRRRILDRMVVQNQRLGFYDD